ncbi:MAG: class IV adenylate cyclase [Candidatus Shapirobacteria bacterium]|jgi:adenylate cyclase class 2
MSDNQEIEIKIQIESNINLFSFLEKEAKFIGEKHQIDKYFTPAHKNFIEPRPVKEWLRLRDSSGKFSINYKNWHYDTFGKSNYCNEYETPIESLQQLEKIFDVLDIKEVVTVDKVRKLYLYQEYEIAIDSVKNLGDFVEIEFKGNVNGRDPAEITNEMVTFLKKIDCGKISRNFVGYPFQLLFPEEVVFEEQ